MLKMTEEINEIMDIGYAMATEKYFQRLFDLLLKASMKFTGADSGEIFVTDQRRFTTIIHVNKTLDKRGDHYDPIEEYIDIRAMNMVTYAVSHREVLNIEDIYVEKQFETLKIKEFDKYHEYRTKSVMVVPIYEIGSKIIGVMRLINCTDDDGNLVSFPSEYEKLVGSLTSQMSISLTTMQKMQEMDELLDSFVKSMTTAIDARTPYNANHTKNVAKYCEKVVEYMNMLHTRGEFREFISEDDKEQLLMAARLHDLGKMITPREVLNKATRLGILYDGLVARLQKIQLMLKIDMLEGRLDKADWTMEDLRLTNFLEELPQLNIKGRLEPGEVERIKYMGTKIYKDPDGKEIEYLTVEEVKSLSIAKGTLTAEERKIVEQHVVFTDKMLAEIKFNEKYDRVRKIASCHHEYLDGTGYPNHLRAEDLDMLTRILTIVDIYDSLTSTDRPYKGTVPPPKAIKILEEMAHEGKLDIELVGVISDCMWEMEKNKVSDLV